MNTARNFKIHLLQKALTAEGFYTGAIDGIDGPKTKAAYKAYLATKLIGSATWKWHAEIDGVDIVVRNVWATAFGGNSDPQDNGKTASGYSTKDHPELVACALPMDGYGIRSLRGSPLPRMPFGLNKDGTQNKDGAFVVATFNGTKTPPMPVIDLGPSAKDNAIDLTVAAAQIFHPHASATNFKAKLTEYTILGGKKWLKKL